MNHTVPKIQKLDLSIQYVSSSTLKMYENPREEAMTYFEKHKVLQTFEYLGSKLACERPSDPNSFLVAEISKILASQARSQKVSLFSESDLVSLFSVFDLTGKGYLSKSQFFRALDYVGVDNRKIEVPEQIEKLNFVKLILAELSKTSI